MKTEEKKVKYGFGLSDTECFCDMFDTVEEVIEFADGCYKNPDGNYWDEDMDDYPDCIYIGTIEHHTASDFAPSLDDIADQMTDSFYCEYNIDDNKDVSILNRKDAEVEWKAFIEKYFEIPGTYMATWNVGIYDLKEHKWVEQFGKNKEVKK
jgi:hypothetical protein